jgi:hypothetical protein
LHRAIDLAFRVGDRLAGFCRDRLGKFIPAAIERAAILENIMAGMDATTGGGARPLGGDILPTSLSILAPD